jgi:hypothetical protein
MLRACAYHPDILDENTSKLYILECKTKVCTDCETNDQLLKEVYPGLRGIMCKNHQTCLIDNLLASVYKYLDRPNKKQCLK